MNPSIYQKFSRVLVEVGVNLQPGETVIIQAEPEHQDLVRELTRTCYQCGARYVWTEYTDEAVNQIRAEFSRDEYLNTYPQWLFDYRKAYGEDTSCIICLRSPRLEEPTLVSDKLFSVQTAERQCSEGFQSAVADGSVSIVKTVVPSRSWAKLVYPELEESSALDRLWTTFLYICRLNEDDPVSAWKAHQELIRQKREQLDKLELDTLILKGPGTDLTVGLVHGGHWIGGCIQNTRTGMSCVPNIPTEEIFFVPDKRRINGVVSSTLPLNHHGTLIEGIRLEVCNGEVTAFSAQKGEDSLAAILNTDEGSKRFGEISLVSSKSRIYQTQTLFYDTLLDENAVCHMALGRGTPGILENGYQLSPEELDTLGINSSAIHVDFMIGSDSLDVDGQTKNGGCIPILRGGDWVI